MKTLMIGSTSIIGGHIATRLGRFGEVKFAGRRAADIDFDITKWDVLPKVNESFDVVVHVAADFGGTTTESFIRTELANAVGTLSVCRVAELCSAKHFFLLSSLFATYRLGDPYYGIYALSKRHAEEAALFFCNERGIPLTVLRPSQVYDEAGKCRRHQKLLYAMADKAEAGEDICLFGSHDARRNYIYLDNVARFAAAGRRRHARLF